MNVELTHHIDSSEPNADGTYEYYYEYDLYRFSQNDLTVVVRAYSDEPGASVLRMEVDGKSRPMTLDDLNHPLITDVVRYLHDAGKSEVKWMSGRGGYEPIVFPA